MRNQYMAKVLVHNKVVTEDVIKTYWDKATDEKDIGQVLVEAGALSAGVYQKVLAFVKNIEAKNAAAQPAAAPAAPAASAAPAAPSPVAKPAAPKAMQAVEVQSAAPQSEEPALQIEGNNIFGMSSSSNMEMETVSGLETTSIAGFGLVDLSNDEEEDENGLPSRFTVVTGEGEPVEAPDTLPIKAKLKKIVAFARKFGATDIYLFADRQIFMRQSGAIFPATELTLNKSMLMDLLSEASEGFSDGYKVSIGKNFTKSLGLAGVGRIRMTVTWNDVVPNIAIRVIQTESASLENLFLPPFCNQFAGLSSGLVLIAGPSSSGRSTTMKAFAETIAASRSCYIQTIERPIERLIQNPNGGLAQKEVGLHVRTSLEGISLGIRDGADVICFDQLETMEELSLLLQAANAGALVFAVTSGNSIHALLSRLLVSVPESNRASFACSLAEQLKGVIVQHLVPVVQNQGLVLAAEALRVSSTVANMIRRGDLSQLAAAISSQKDQGITLDDSLQKCLESGYIDGYEAWKRAYDSRRFAAYRPSAREA